MFVFEVGGFGEGSNATSVVKPFAKEQASQTQKALGVCHAATKSGVAKDKGSFHDEDLPATKGVTGAAFAVANNSWLTMICA